MPGTRRRVRTVRFTRCLHGCYTYENTSRTSYQKTTGHAELNSSHEMSISVSTRKRGTSCSRMILVYRSPEVGVVVLPQRSGLIVVFGRSIRKPQIKIHIDSVAAGGDTYFPPTGHTVLLWVYYVLPAVRRVWLFATVVMYIERSEREAKGPHGSFTCSQAALVQHVLLQSGPVQDITPHKVAISLYSFPQVQRDEFE
jgi:hypothetical protein